MTGIYVYFSSSSGTEHILVFQSSDFCIFVFGSQKWFLQAFPNNINSEYKNKQLWLALL